MVKIQELLDKLNEEQIKPVLDTEGAVLVIAGAGSGKTRVLTTRIAYLIMEKNVPAHQIMAITFTNKAAGEMKERLEKIVGDINDMWVSTIHSMCVRILRKDIDKLGYDKNFTIYDETDKEKVLKRVFEETGLDADALLKTAKNVISTAKNDCLKPLEWKKENSSVRFSEEITQIYTAYENQLARSNALDFDDLLFKTYELFCLHPEVAEYYSNKFKYIHIDEFQDTNTVQFAIAQALCKKHGNIFVVGDDDQSIYGWRGAKIENILSFDDIFRGAKVYKLERNYRSTKNILNLANCIIANNVERRQKQLWTDNCEGVKVETFVGTDENNEAAYVAMQIINLMKRNVNLLYSDFAVFMRVNALSRAFEQEFMKYGIPCKVFGGFRFFERKEIKDVLSYLKVIVNSNDNESFLRCVSFPKRGIGDKTLRELREFCQVASISLYDGVFRLEQTSIGSAAKTKLFNFGNLLDNFKAYAKNNSVARLIDYILETTGFLEQFAEKSEENTSRLYNISELKNSAEQFEKDNPGSTLTDYLNSVTLSSDTDDINNGDAVTIATIHAAKGLEYKNVFVAGLDEKILPIARSVDDESEMEEERRLMYVSITRAMERLYLTRAMSRYMYGKRENMFQSRFLKEAQHILFPRRADEEIRRKENSYGYSSREYSRYEDDSDSGYTSSSGGYSSQYAKSFIQANKPKANTSVNYEKYKTGVKVRHVKFGEGTVINTKGSGDNLIVDVAFKGVGIKSLSAKFAPMEIL
ncbi:MAG: UvrD-helicase domain-containing protein [Clostridia bacterium]|nr:UvrD-helicase domain-containing protein [Clostridia bacterium]